MANTRRTSMSAAAAALLLWGCATEPRPDEAMQEAVGAITRADDARASDFAAPEMRSAHEKLEAARELASHARQDKDDKEARKARWLAEEARADADLAAAKAMSVRTRAAARALERESAAPAPR